MNQLFFVLTILIPLIFNGCATSESTGVVFDPATGMSTFESDRFMMGYRNMSSGLASNQRVMWQALAACSGEDCTPDEVTLVFFNDTSQHLNLDSSRLRLIVDGTEHEWQDLSRVVESPHYTVPTGEFVRISLGGGIFANFARAQKVEIIFGETGTSVFRVSFERRAKFREFAEAVGLGE